LGFVRLAQERYADAAAAYEGLFQLLPEDGSGIPLTDDRFSHQVKTHFGDMDTARISLIRSERIKCKHAISQYFTTTIFPLDAPFLVKSNSHQMQISKYNLQRLTDIFGSEQLKAI
jgi:hypothetical protein